MAETAFLSSPDLQRLTAAQWLQLVAGLAQGNPELARNFRFLEAVLARQQSESLRKLTHPFIGASKCPSVSGCERLAARTRWITALVTGDVLQPAVRAELFQAALEKLLPACEGADDRNAVFRPAVRDCIQKGLACIAAMDVDARWKVDCLFPLALADQCTVVEPLWWWNCIVRLDAAHALDLARLHIEQLGLIEPSPDKTWKTLGGRWVRLRLKSFLEHVGDKTLLAELMAKSAVDDFEAAFAVNLLRELHRGREALALAERWHRLMPASPVLGWALAEAYLEDGWDEEALKLLTWHYERDPNPRWLALVEKAAGEAWPAWQARHIAPT